MAVVAPLALGALGAWAAPAGYAALGFSIGSAVGSMLVPGPEIFNEGPRLNDLSIQASTYGRPIPRLWGSHQLAGNVIWAQPLREVATDTTSGGKGGGPEVTTRTYSYFATFAVQLCEGPIEAISRVWFDAVLVYDQSEGASYETLAAIEERLQSKISVYLGSETQTADSVIESYEGSGNVPGYRGTAYIVFDDINVDEWRRIPNVTVEVLSKATDTHSNTSVKTLTGGGVAWNNTISDPQNDVCTAFIGQWNATYGNTNVEVYDILPDGTEIERGRINVGGSGVFASGTSDVPCIVTHTNAAWAGYYYLTEKDGVNYKIHSNLDRFGQQARFYREVKQLHGLGGGDVIWMANRDHPSLDKTISRHEYANTADPGWYEVARSAAMTHYINSIHATENYLYALAQTDSADFVQLFKLDKITLDLVSTELMDVKLVDDNWAHQMISDDIWYGWRGTNFYRFESNVRTDTWTGVLGTGNQLSFGFVSDNLVRFQRGSVNTTIAMSRFRTGADTVTIRDVIADICDDAGLGAAYIDTTGVTANEVRGYAVTRPMSARAALQPLQQKFWFDIAEHTGKVYFVERGGAAADTVPESDLAAHRYGGQQPELFELRRAQDADLPRRVTVNYRDPALDGQQNSQYASRITTAAVRENLVELPLLMTANEAAKTAEVLLYDAWQGRQTVRFSIPAEDYIALNPTDVIDVTFASRTYSIRLTKIDFDIPAVFNCEGVVEDSSIYTPVAVGHAPDTQTQTLGISGPTYGRVLDIALLRDQDDPGGIYVAATGPTTAWPGAAFLLSLDGGTTYTIEAVIGNRAVMGFASTALSSHPDPVIDHDNTLAVTLYRSDDSLSSITENQLLNFNNAAIIGDEILGFQNATNTSGTDWDLDDLLRSQRGTDWAEAAHANNENFILLSTSTVYRIEIADEWIGSELFYKFVTFGKQAADVDAESFTYSGTAYKPYAPAMLEALDAGAGNYDVTWERRTRIGGAWRDYVDASLGEDSEEYTVKVFNGASEVSSTTTSSKSATVAASPGYTIKVAQNSATVGPGYYAEVTV